jgi:hypothetical protein
MQPHQRELVLSLVERLKTIPGVVAVVLGGSHARGRAQPDSDIDLGLLYSEAAPFSTGSIRELANSVNDAPDPVVSEFYGWGPWVNGGAWLTVRGQRVDLLYRNLDQVERVIVDADAGKYEVHYLQQPPFGFFSGTYLGEVAVCVPLHDPTDRLAALKRRVAEYPETLRKAVVRDYLFMAEFTLSTFAPKFAARSDTFGTAACLTRGVNELVMALFALNRKYLLNDKTALAEVAAFEIAPKEFAPRAQKALERLTDLSSAVAAITQLAEETVELADGLYRPQFALPK